MLIHPTSLVIFWAKNTDRPNTVVEVKFSSLSTTDRSAIQKINKSNLKLNKCIDQMDLTDVCRVFHLATVLHTLFSAAHGTFFKLEYIYSHNQ
jgi:hypothetical protein